MTPGEIGFVDLLDSGYIDRFDQRQQGEVYATPTPLPTWNKYCGDDGGGRGLAPQWLIVIGGNPKFGKSLLALNLAKYALIGGESVGFMSLEMTDPQLAARFYAMIGQIPIHHLEMGRYKADIERIFEAARSLALSPVAKGGRPVSMFVNSEPIFDLRLLMETMYSLYEEGVRWFIVDYLQLVSLGDEEKAARITSMAMAEMRKFVRTTGSVAIALSQFKRETAENYDTSPRIQGLLGGTMIEATADQIVLLDHSRYDRDAVNRKLARSWVSLTNRHGEHGDIPILWNYETLEIREGLEDEESLWPTHANRGRRR